LLFQSYSDSFIKNDFKQEHHTMQTVDLNQAKQRLPRLIEQTMCGEEIVITQGGQPLVKLVALTRQRRKHRQFGSAKGLIRMPDDFDEPIEDFKEYM
jgi:prevent-host-death family protein